MGGKDTALGGLTVITALCVAIGKPLTALGVHVGMLTLPIARNPGNMPRAWPIAGAAYKVLAASLLPVLPY